METDSLQISLITCSPGQDTYAMFGHTGIRVNYVLQNRDVVFNYGMFNYKSENFIYRFVKGETDYILGVEPSYYFFTRYDEPGITVTEQVLNLTDREKETLARKLEENALPQNRTYRYNWLYDNCTTRARDIIESSINGKVTYQEANTDTSVTTRTILHTYTSVSDWTRFGIDIILGEEIDRPLSDRQQMFIPANYMASAGQAVITDGQGNQRPLVSSTVTPIQSDSLRHTDNNHSSLMCTTGLLFIAAGLAFLELRRKKTYKWFDASLAFLLGLAGCLVAFLFFASEHAGVSTNYLVILLNPLHFIAIPFIIKRKTRIVSYVMLADMVLLLLTILATGQTVNTAILPVVFTLLVRVIVNLRIFSYLCIRK